MKEPSSGIFFLKTRRLHQQIKSIAVISKHVKISVQCFGSLKSNFVGVFSTSFRSLSFCLIFMQFLWIFMWVCVKTAFVLSILFINK